MVLNYHKPDRATAVSAFVTYLACGLVLAAVVQGFVLKPYLISEGSMAPNLVRGDQVVVSRTAYGWSRYSLPFGLPLFQGRVGGAPAQHGDLAVFKLPRDGATSYANRVIGRPGDRVELISGRLVVNGQPYSYRFLPQTEVEHRKNVRRAVETNGEGRAYVVYLKDCPPTTAREVFHVPIGAYFFLGDNRDDSLDSRFREEIGIGYVPEENLEGRIEFILTSWTRRASLVDVHSWFSEMRLDRFFTHPS